VDACAAVPRVALHAVMGLTRDYVLRMVKQMAKAWPRDGPAPGGGWKKRWKRGRHPA